MKAKVQTKRFRPKFHVKSGDMVLVLSGDYKGKTGRVLEIITKMGKAIVENINIVTKRIKPTRSAEGNKPGEIRKEPAPIPLSKLMVVGSDGTPSRTGRRRDENGRAVRYSKKTGEVL